MVVLLTVLIILVGLALIIGYLFAGIETGMWLHTLYPLYTNTKRSIESMVKPGVVVKAKSIGYYWQKTDFGDYDTRWILVNPQTREKEDFDIIVRKDGSIVRIDKYEISNIKNYLKIIR